jgi:hypothetical protein
VKYKADQGQEFVIGGYKPGKYGFEYLLAGYYEGTDRIFVAKIKNGFVPHLRRDIARKFDAFAVHNLSFCESAGTQKCPAWRGHNGGRDEENSLVKAATGRAGRLHGMDQQQSLTSFAFHRTSRR